MSEIALSDPQERTLIDLAPVDAEEPRWKRSGGLRGPRRANTLGSLERLGLVEGRTVYGSLAREYRISKAGIELLATMGDPR